MDQVKDGPERLSTGELVHLIDEIAAGRGSVLFPEGGIPEDNYWPSDFPAKPGLDAIQDQIKREQSVIDEKLKAGGSIYVVTAYGPNRVHRSICHHVSHALDRTEAWKAVLEDYATLRPADVRVTKMPRLFTRQEAEALNSYVVCTVCAPDLDHPRKKFRFPARPMKAKSFGLHHVGRAIFTLEGEDLGFFISHQRIVSAQGIQSVTTTTQRVIEGHGDCEEQFIVAPKDLI